MVLPIQHHVTIEIKSELLLITYIKYFINAPKHMLFLFNKQYHKTSNIRRTLLGDKIVDNSDVVGALPVGAAPTTSSFST